MLAFGSMYSALTAGVFELFDPSMRRFLLVTGIALLCDACNSDDPALRDALLDEGAETPAELAARRETYRPRLDLARSQIEMPSDEDLPEQRPFDWSILQAALARSGATSIEAQEDAKGARYVIRGPHSGRIDAAQRTIEMSHVEGYESEFDADVTQPMLAVSSTDIMRAMGIDPREVEQETVKLGVSERALGNKVAGTRQVGHKVFSFRLIRGVPVPAHRMVMSYALDGSLRSIRGTWPQIRFERSSLHTSVTADDVVELALDALVDANVATDSPAPITIRSYFEAHPLDDQTVAIRLRGGVTTQATGPDGKPGMGIEHGFDIGAASLGPSDPLQHGATNPAE